MMILRTLKVIASRAESVFWASGKEVAKKRKKELESELDAPVVWAAVKLLHDPRNKVEAASQDDMDESFANLY